MANIRGIFFRANIVARKIRLKFSLILHIKCGRALSAGARLLTGATGTRNIKNKRCNRWRFKCKCDSRNSPKVKFHYSQCNIGRNGHGHKQTLQGGHCFFNRSPKWKSCYATTCGWRFKPTSFAIEFLRQVHAGYRLRIRPNHELLPKRRANGQTDKWRVYQPLIFAPNDTRCGYARHFGGNTIGRKLSIGAKN